MWGQPGEIKSVVLVSIGGKKEIYGGNSLVNGPVNPGGVQALMERIRIRKFGHLAEPDAE